MEKKISELFEKWLKSIQDYYDYTEWLFRFTEAKNEMTFEELISFGNEKGVFVGTNNSIIGKHEPLLFANELLIDGVQIIKNAISPDLYYYNNFITNSYEFIKTLIADNIENTDYKGKINGFKRKIDLLKEKNQKRYINQFSYINDFLEIYSEMTGESTKPILKKTKIMTEPQKALLIFFILRELKNDLAAIKYYTLMADLTDNSTLNTKQYFDSGFQNLYQTKTGNHRIDDLNFIRDYFKTMGLNKLSQNVQNELNRIKDPKK